MIGSKVNTTGGVVGAVVAGEAALGVMEADSNRFFSGLAQAKALNGGKPPIFYLVFMAFLPLALFGLAFYCSLADTKEAFEFWGYVIGVIGGILTTTSGMFAGVYLVGYLIAFLFKLSVGVLIFPFALFARLIRNMRISRQKRELDRVHAQFKAEIAEFRKTLAK